jgi:cytochrome P450
MSAVETFSPEEIEVQNSLQICMESLFDPETFEKDGFPHELFDQLRPFGDVIEQKRGAYGDPEQSVHHAIGYEAARDILSNSNFITSPNTAFPFDVPKEGIEVVKDMILNQDGRVHQRHRSEVSKAMTPGKIKTNEHYQMVTDWVDEVLTEAVENGEIDFVDIASRAPYEVTFALIDAPQDQREMLANALDKIGNFGAEDQTTEEDSEAKKAAGDIFLYAITRMGAENHTEGSLLEGMVNMYINEMVGEPEKEAKLLDRMQSLSDEQQADLGMKIGSYILLLGVAGTDTTKNATTLGEKLLMENAEQANKMYDDLELLKNTVEEIIRHTSPVMAFRRTLSKDAKDSVIVGGQEIKPGEQAIVWFPAANHDPNQFPNPHEFDIERPNANEHLAFGKNEHFCPGNNLARHMMTILFTRMVERGIRFEPNGDLVRNTSAFIDGAKSLPVKTVSGE